MCNASLCECVYKEQQWSLCCWARLLRCCDCAAQYRDLESSCGGCCIEQFAAVLSSFSTSLHCMDVLMRLTWLPNLPDVRQ